MSQTPSNRRREGRNAFSPDLILEDVCPYAKTHWGSHASDWAQGWREARQAYIEAQEEQDRLRPYRDEIEQLETVDDIKDYLTKHLLPIIGERND